MKKNIGSRELWIWTLMPWVYSACSAITIFASIVANTTERYTYPEWGSIAGIVACSGVVMLIPLYFLQRRVLTQEQEHLDALALGFHRWAYLIGVVAYIISGLNAFRYDEYHNPHAGFG